VATVCTGAWYLAVNKPRSRFIGFSFTDLSVARIQAYKSFYADYDAERDFQRMKAIPGLFQSTALIAEKAEEGGEAEEEE